MMDPPRKIPKPIQRRLNQLRRQIRRYIWLQGLTIAIAWIGAAYWIGLAMDYLPVRAGSSEMPRAARIGLIVAIGLVLAVIAYRWILRRIVVRWRDANLALVLERRFPSLNDALLTAVQTSKVEDQADDATLRNAMVDRAIDIAAQRTEKLEIRDVLNLRPLLRSSTAATVAILSIVIFAFLARDTWAIWTSRFLLQSDAPWPRRAAIELLDFPEGSRKVAEGSDVVILVRADASRPVTPDFCSIVYQVDGNDQGRVNMSRSGEPRDGYQYYRYEGAPFQGMLDAVTFDVIGFDYRIANQRVEVVPSPSVTQVDLQCDFPTYMNRIPSRLIWAPGTRLPIGTKILLTATSLKPLREAKITLQEQEVTHSITFPEGNAQSVVEFDMGMLKETTSLSIELMDLDLVTSDQPYLITISAVEDMPPQVTMNLEGIGTAITSKANIPTTGEIVDDYGVRESWFQLDVPAQSAMRKVPLSDRFEGQFSDTLDLRLLGREDASAWKLEPGDQLILSLKSTDAYDLTDQRHTGRSDDYKLDVVTDDELLALLEARELGLKQRFEQVLSELSDTRDSLLRVQAELSGAVTQQDDEEIDPKQLEMLRMLRVQRGAQQAGKSQQEVAGVAEAFSDIRAQLINNRVDTPERSERLLDRIITPLEAITENDFPAWMQNLRDLEQSLDQTELAKPLSEQSVAAANDLIFALQQVLQSMLELETFNELIDLVRGIVKEQERLQEQTAKEEKRKARALLED